MRVWKDVSEWQNGVSDRVINEAASVLSSGSNGNYDGCRVGEVVQLSLDRNSPGKVWAGIRIAGSTRVRQDTRARLAMAGITGTSNIQLSGGSESSPALNGDDESIPVIIATPSPLNQLLTNGEDLMTNINEVLLRLHQVLTPDNQQRFVNTLDNLEKITDTVASQREDISPILQQLAIVTKQNNETLAQTNRRMRNANVLLDGEGKDLANNAATTLASLQKTSRLLNQLVSDN